MNFRQLCHCHLLLLPLLFAGFVEAGEQATQQLSLTQAVEQALISNLNLSLQRDDTEIATGSLEIAQSRFDAFFALEAQAVSDEMTPLFPGGAEEETTTSLVGSYSKRFSTGTEIEVSLGGSRFESDSAGLLFDPSFGSFATLSLTQPLLKGWGREIQLAEVEASQQELDAATFQVDSLAADLAAQVKVGYWNLVFAWQDIKVKELSLTLAQQLLEETREKIKAGRLAEVEIFQPQSEVARREQALISAERAIGTADDELKLLLNSKDWLTPFTPTDKPSSETVTLDPEEIYSNSLENRPDIQSARRTITAAHLRQKLAKDNTRPALDIIGSVGIDGTESRYSDSLETTVDNPNDNWLVGLNLTFPIDNSAAKGALRQAKANSSKAATNLKLLQLQIHKDVRTTVRDVRLAIKAMEATRKTSLATQKRLEAEEAKFAAGRATTLDVLIAQESYSQALSQENLTQVQYMQALAELDRIQGMITLDNSL